MKILRPFQVEANVSVERAIERTGRALVHLATGLGKTLTAAKLVESRRPKGRALFIAHRVELVDQGGGAFADETSLSVGIEHADRRVSFPLPDVVVASTQTLMSAERIGRFPRDAFATVICDEAHHYSKSAAGFCAVPLYFQGAALVGFTATPDRADGEPLIFGPPVYRMGIREGVRQSFLVDIRRAVCLVADLDTSRVKVSAGDYDDAQLQAELMKAPALASVVDAVLRHSGDRTTVLFCAGILHSKALAAALNAQRPGCAAAASGDDRRGVADLVAGRVRILCNTDLTTEGFDLPRLSCVGLVRPTKSRGRATQQIGRGTRLSPGKQDLLVLEFTGATTAGQVSTVDVVGADLPERIRLAAERLLDRSPSLSVLTALERAGAQAGSTLVGRGERVRAVIDPMRLILSLDGMVMEPARPGSRPATPEQAAQLQAEGLVAAGLTIRQAALLLEGIRWRRQRHLSSPTEALELYRFGHAIDVKRDVARRNLATLRGAA